MGSRLPGRKVGTSVRMPRATREHAGRTGPGAPFPQGQKREIVAAIGNFKCPNWQRGEAPPGCLQSTPPPSKGDLCSVTQDAVLRRPHKKDIPPVWVKAGRGVVLKREPKRALPCIPPPTSTTCPQTKRVQKKWRAGTSWEHHKQMLQLSH